MSGKVLKLFLASAHELKLDRDYCEQIIRRKNDAWQRENKPYIELQMWETSSNALSLTRSQNEYNDKIRQADIFILLLWRELGKYTQEEYELAKALFQMTGKPDIIIYQKQNGDISEDLEVFFASFREDGKEYFRGRYAHQSELELKIGNELDSYLFQRNPPDPSNWLKNRNELLQGLQKRYSKRLTKKMEEELNFKLKLQLIYTGEGTDLSYRSDYFLNPSDIGNVNGFDQLFADYTTEIKRLLILGDPGSGKTVLLLEFAIASLQKAMVNPLFPIPVILNLATWRDNKLTFKKWLEQNLVYAAGEYGTSKKYARELAMQHNLVLLLDGLDEVPAQFRESCVSRLHEYIIHQENSRPDTYPQMIVSSRRVEYAALISHVPVKATVLISPLDPAYLIEVLETKKSNSAANKLLRSIKSTTGVAEKLTTPFQVHLALHLAHNYEFGNPGAVSLLVAYISQELEIANEKTRGETKRFLSFLATQLSDGQKGVTFELTDIQPDWVIGNGVRHGSRGSKKGWVMYFVTFLLTRFIFLFVTLSILQYINLNTKNKPVTAQNIEYSLFMILLFSASTSIASLIFGLGRKFDIQEIRTFTLREFTIKSLFKNVFRQFRKHFLQGICFFVLLAPPLMWKTHNYIPLNLSVGISVLIGGILGLILALMLAGTIWALFIGIVNGVVNSFFEVKRNPIIKKSYARFASPFLFDLIRLMIVYISFFGLFNKWKTLLTLESLISFFLVSLVSALYINPIFKHITLRLILRAQNQLPSRLRTFLDKVAETGLLEKDGGQWRFKHQLIQDYFANSAKEGNRPL